MDYRKRRVVFVICGIAAMSVVIALGASSTQGGLLGAVIILATFTIWGQKPK